MKKKGILNSEIATILAGLGHTDSIAIADCGLPIKSEVKRIDLALQLGVPGFIDVLKVVADDMKIEKIILAEEIKTKNSQCLAKIEEIFKDHEIGVEIKFVSHENFKELTKECKAVVRTGENTPYANIILQSGCIF